MEPCKPPPISKMSKTELLSEANRVGLVVHRSWTNEELKAVIQEHRMSQPNTHPATQMKSITNLTMPELKLKAQELKVEFPSNVTKGNLLRLIRDSLATPATELMKIGKYKGWEFGEIPNQYGMWAAREIRMSANPHVELVRYAKWWESEQHRIHYGTPIEDNATVPFPREESVQGTASSVSSAWTEVDYQAPYKPMRRGQSSAGYDKSFQDPAVWDLPKTTYQMSPKQPKRGASSSSYDKEVMEEMESEADPGVLEEIRALEAKLAALKQKELLTGTFAPMSSENYGEDGEIYQDGNDLGPRPPQAQEPRHHQGNVHRPPVRDLCRSYKHIGCHFGSKTDEHRTGCCERDAQTSSSGIFLSETDPADANHHKYYNFPCAPTCQDPANLITRAIADHDCSFSTLAKVLHEADFKEVKTTRDGVFSKSGDWANYHTVGLYTHGGTYGVTNKTKDQHSLVRYINQFGKHHLGPQASWTSVTVSYNASTAVHHDFHNLRGSRNYTASFGQRRGGGLWVEDRAVREDDLPKGIKWRQAGSGHWLPGRVVDTNEKFYEFDPFLKHGTETWEGDRWCLTYHTTRNYPKIGGHLKDYLKKCGFPLPKMPKGSREAEVNRKPGRTTRKAIFNNAAKIGVMMTTLISAARSYIASLDSPQVQANPVVIFEIGGTSATQEAAELGKDVFEPMSWERYGTSEGKLDAFHIVNGGSPRELRLKLQGKQARCDEAVTELIQQQIDDGGTVVIKGEANDSLFDNQVFKQVGRPCVQYEDNNDEGVFVVLFRSKDSIITIRCPDRVHGVCAVDHDVGGGQEAVAKLGGGGITFGKDVAPSIASALRRLHQNLGHPQQDDLVRHLRLAGCEGDVLKAAKSMRCQVCEANAAPKVARPSTLPHLYDWNDTLGIDLFYAHDANDEKHTFLSVVDFGTTYHLATKVDGASADDIEAKFNEMWVVPFGPPKSVAIDLETGLQAALGRLCDWHGIGVRSVATQSHWQAGMVERQQAWWKSVWERVVYQLTVGDDEVAIAASIVNSAKNELRRRCGYSPSQWVFGKSPRTPEELQDPDGGHHALWDVTQDARHQRQSAIRAAARVAFHESQNDSRLRKALLQRTRVTSRPYDIGESVHYWHKPKNRRRGEWSGPAIIVGKEGGNYWLSKGGRCRLTSPEHMRPTTPEEVGTFLAMRNTKDEVERLLDYDPDADETYETEGEGDMIVDEDEGGGAGEIDYGGEDIILDPVEENEVEEPRPPRYRLKRKTTAEDAHPKRHEAMLLKTDLTRRGVEKRKEKELRWAEIPQEVHEKFREAERQQWQEHMSFDALEALSSEASAEVRARVPPERILRCRWAYKDKNYARRRDGEDVPWKCKSRLVIAGHTDPDLTNESLHLSTDAPTLSRCGFSCLMQITANGLQEADPWSMSAGDIRCAFLTGSYLRRELFMHQPRTGFPGMLPGQLVRIKKKCVWTCDESTRVVVKVGHNYIEVTQEKYAQTRLFQVSIPHGAEDSELATDELISDNRSLIGALSWMSAQTRPDLTCSVSMCQQLQKAPTYGDIRFTNQVANKAQLHKHRGLRYNSIDKEKLMFVVYHDAAWANVPEPDPLEEFYVLTPQEDQDGLQKEGPFYEAGNRKAKKGNSKVASQLGVLVAFVDRGCIGGHAGHMSVADWKSQESSARHFGTSVKEKENLSPQDNKYNDHDTDDADVDDDDGDNDHDDNDQDIGNYISKDR
ncbi:hypothetical protein AK812_SmicGene18412 [Symbiodinium microadriaticum]|uniref:Integrase catalytic domain-containing protein n=1 Tax=Symbiodinium microadriaticum TaxID=2951 RepID=A0A1Q9DV95_SYMMI|nr:hypothetical protein AK812_SmicGene18412 [Symbiodinium microadriaticum]